MMFAGFFFLLMQVANSWLEPTSLPPPAKVVRDVIACGLSQSATRTAVEHGSGDDIVAVAGVHDLSDDKLGCVADASLTTYTDVTFDDEALSHRYMTIYFAHAEVRERRAARAALARHGLLQTLPVYDPSTSSLADYAIRLERLCGVEAGSYLAVSSASMLTLAPALLTVPQVLKGPSGDRTLCVHDAIAASNLGEHHVFFGFIGNEAAPEAPTAEPPP